MNRTRIDMEGQTFGRLRVLGLHSVPANGHRRWACVCDCGQEVVVYGISLRSSLTRSCGCLRREISSQRMLAGAARAIRQVALMSSQPRS